MLSSKAPRSAALRTLAAGAVLTLATLSVSACGGNSTATSTNGSAEKIGVSLIVKTTSNPFFVSMQDGAKKAAEGDGVDL
jgi:fructose transport system substrate-binding protein